MFCKTDLFLIHCFNVSAGLNLWLVSFEDAVVSAAGVGMWSSCSWNYWQPCVHTAFKYSCTHLSIRFQHRRSLQLTRTRRYAPPRNTCREHRRTETAAWRRPAEWNFYHDGQQPHQGCKINLWRVDTQTGLCRDRKSGSPAFGPVTNGRLIHLWILQDSYHRAFGQRKLLLRQGLVIE